MDLENLIAEFQKKEISAFEKLYTMYAENMCGIIFHIVKNRHDAEEICQDVFLKAWHNSHKYDAGKGRFFTWLLNIARNSAIDCTRSKVYKNNSKTICSADISNFDCYNSYVMDGQIDTIGLNSLLGNLAKKNRMVIILFYLKGYTHSEISEQLNIPIGTVKTRNRSGVLQLRKNLARMETAISSSLVV